MNARSIGPYLLAIGAAAALSCGAASAAPADPPDLVWSTSGAAPRAATPSPAGDPYASGYGYGNGYANSRNRTRGRHGTANGAHGATRSAAPPAANGQKMRRQLGTQPPHR